MFNKFLTLSLIAVIAATAVSTPSYAVQSKEDKAGKTNKASTPAKAKTNSSN